MPLDNKCRIGPLAGAPQRRVRWSSALRLNRDSSLKMTRLSQSVTLKVARGRQKSVDTAYDVGSVVSVLADVGSSSQLRSVVSLWFLLMALDVWKEVSGVESMLATLFGAEVATLLIARSSRSFVFLGRPDPPATVHSTFCDPLLPTPSNYHIAPTEVAADTSIRPTCFSEAYYTAPIKVRQLLVLPPVTS
ncbi:hypothetical protein TNCV_2488471 [Trichonephila clavipes]|nr:hypothetical protein TNCV_2488471 [Trichonephila clavipes]